MHFTLPLAALLALTTALPTAPALEPTLDHVTHNDTNLATSDTASTPLEKRVLSPVAVSIISSAASAVMTPIVNAAVKQIGQVANWDEARTKFVKATVAEMYRHAQRGEAAVCYNKQYALKHPNQIRALTSMQFKSGLLHTDYDCFFLRGPDNWFWSQGDGGYINLGVEYPGNCKFNDKSDLYCN